MDTIFNISLPTSWAALDDQGLLFVFRQIARQLPAAELKARCLFHFARLKVIARPDRHTAIIQLSSSRRKGVGITARQIETATHTLDFLDTIPPTPVRISKIPTLPMSSLGLPFGRAGVGLPSDFQGVPFEQYLYTDNLYQGYLHTRSEDLLRQMAQVLYQSDRVRPTQAHLIGCFYWFASLKALLAREFPHFLQPIGQQSPSLGEGQGVGSAYHLLREATNAQIRALTGGDITKEKSILRLDTWRALTELDARAKESEDLARIHKR